MVAKKDFTRRGFLAGSMAAVSVLANETGIAFDEVTMSKGKKRKVGLQLYSVRQDCGKDLEGTLAKVAQMGYMGVEFAGYYGRSAEDMRKLLDANGLRCCGTHTGLDTLLGDNLKATIEYNKTIGNKYLIVPSLPAKNRGSHEAWLETAKLFNELAAQVKPYGMLVGYHNHSVEFKPIDEKLPWDTFMQNTRQDVIMQLDTGNCCRGGADPFPFIYRYPERAVTVHVKEYSKKNDKSLIGEGDLNWKAFFALCEAVGGTDWYIVEHERYAYPPLECVERCLKNLQKMKLV
jgi:sugar phosphate isomerase/epimerase